MLNQCDISIENTYSLAWNVIENDVVFNIFLDNITEYQDFWIGVGFRKFQVSLSGT